MNQRALLLSFLLLFGGFSKAQITSVTPDSCQPGQSVNVSIVGNNTFFNSASALYLTGPGPRIDGMFTSISNNVLAGNFTVPAGAPTGNYTLSVESGAPVATWNFFKITGNAPNPNVGTVTGKVFRDINLNCSPNLVPPHAYSVVEFNPGPYFAYTDANGFYSVNLPVGTYTASYTPTGQDVLNCPVGGTHTVNLPTLGAVVNGIDFGLTGPGTVDVQSWVSSYLLRPGFNTSVYGRIKDLNSSTGTGVFKLAIPPFTTYIGASPTPSMIAPGGDTIYWNYGLYANNNWTQDYYVDINVLPATPIGTPFTFYSKAEPSGPELNPANNEAVFSGLVVGGYDPNDKRVFLPDGTNADGLVYPQDTLLRYIIRFQNTGTDTAFNITIRDTLAPELDPTTFQLISTSHPCSHTMGINGEMEFFFPWILLPDSGINEPESHGQVDFEIRLRSGLPIGTTAENDASIYFDFQAAVVTNTTGTTICDSLQAFIGDTAQGLTVDFTDLSIGNATQWTWYFGDGDSSLAANPTHTYATPGVYEVCLVVGNSCGRLENACEFLFVGCTMPASQFSHQANELQVDFTDASQGTPTDWFWDFGDGNTSQMAQPQHSYGMPGTYQVCLTASNACGADTLCDSITVTCAAPEAAFSPVLNELQVAFIDQSLGLPQTWFWDFGDGNTSTQQMPAHTYALPGTYQVCLTVTSVCGSDTICGSVTVTCAAPVADWSVLTNQGQADFTDLSTGAPTAWWWDFGDGNTSTIANPSHTYQQEGTYQVCLVASSICGSDTTCQSLTISIAAIQDPQLSSLLVYPNPSAGQFVIEGDWMLDSKVEVNVFNSLGKSVYEDEWAVGNGKLNRSLDLREWPAGVYFLRLASGEDFRVIRLEKQ